MNNYTNGPYTEPSIMIIGNNSVMRWQAPSRQKPIFPILCRYKCTKIFLSGKAYRTILSVGIKKLFRECRHKRHLMQYPRLPLSHIRPRMVRTEMAWIGESGCDERTVGPCQLRCGTVEMLFRHGLDAIDAVAHLNGVQVNLHNTLLGPEKLDEEREISFQALADP